MVNHPDLVRLRARVVRSWTGDDGDDRVCARLDEPDPRELEVLRRQARRDGVELTETHLRRVAVAMVSGPAAVIENWSDLDAAPCGAAGCATVNARRRRRQLKAGSMAVSLARRPAVMGIVNCTPDSFSDGGRFLEPGRATEHGLALVEAGADVLDVGGMSSRPGSDPVPVDEEIRRTEPVVRQLAERAGVPVSIDTCKAEVARRALEAGAVIVNDITATDGDPQMAAVCARHNATVILMHMQGTPQTMQASPRYRDVVSDIYGYLGHRIERAAEAGIDPRRIVIDPGIGFGKTLNHNLQLMAALHEFRSLGCPVLLGASRKRFIGKVTGRDVDNRVGGSLATAAAAWQRGIEMVRVHDVTETVDLLTMLSAIGPAK